MSRINTNVQSLVAQHVLGRQNQDLNTSLQRLSTGLKINTGKDNPAGLIASENLRREQAGISQAIVNTERANNMIGTADGALNEVSALLVELQTLVTDTANSGGLSSEEINANQLQVDAILNSINRIANSTQFGGKKLLDGSLDYTTSSVSSTNLSEVKINSARLADGVTKSVRVEVSTAATFGQLAFSGDTVGSNSVTLAVGGNNGTENLSFAANTAVSAVAAAVNALTDVTGVSATVTAGAGSAVDTLYFNSTGYGEDAFVSVEAVSGSFTVSGGSSSTRDVGTDAVVLVNGQNAEISGLTASLRTATLDVDLTMTAAFGGATGNTTFGITGGGAEFMIGGDVTTANKSSIGVGSVSTASLGNATTGALATLATGGSNSLAGGNGVDAQLIVNAAISEVSNLRGRLGAFQKFTISPTMNSLEVALENASAAESAIRDTDFAAETSALTRSQILSNVATNVLAMANAMPQSVLSLLG